jgi:hypothetical protein
MKLKYKRAKHRNWYNVHNRENKKPTVLKDVSDYISKTFCMGDFKDAQKGVSLVVFNGLARHLGDMRAYFRNDILI